MIGADWWTTMRRIIMPILGPAIFAYTILFVHFFKDYSTAVFLAAPGSEMLGTTMLQMFVSGETGPAVALATIQIVITVLVHPAGAPHRAGCRPMAEVRLENISRHFGAQVALSDIDLTCRRAHSSRCSARPDAASRPRSR